MTAEKGAVMKRKFARCVFLACPLVLAIVASGQGMIRPTHPYNQINSMIALILAGGQQAGGQQPAAPASQSMSQSLGLHAFPAKSQTAAQQQQDEMACYNWAKQDSGFDPIAASAAQLQAQAPQSAQPAAPSTAGAGAKGAAAGAAGGAAVGAITGDAGAGAAAGAAVGAVRGRRAAKRAEKQAQAQTQQKQQQQAQAKAETQHKLDGFKKGFGACMEAKGYVVK